MSPKTLTLLLSCIVSLSILQGCTPVVVAGAAAGGYIARDAGYEVRPPVIKKEKKKEKGQ